AIWTSKRQSSTKIMEPFRRRALSLRLRSIHDSRASPSINQPEPGLVTERRLDEQVEGAYARYRPSRGRHRETIRKGRHHVDGTSRGRRGAGGVLGIAIP